MQRNGRRGVVRSRRVTTSQGDSQEDDVVDIEDARSIEVRGHRVGQLVGWINDRPRVDFPGNPHRRLLARSTVPLSELPRGARVRRRRGSGPEVLLVFDGQRSHRPVIVGLLVDDASVGAATRDRGTSTRGALGHTLGTGEASDDEELVLTGRRVVLEGTAEVVLRSGQASITLRKNGRLVQRGTYLESNSKGVNRIKGGSVKLN